MKKNITKILLSLTIIASMTTPVFATDVNSKSVVNKNHENELKKIYNNFTGKVTEINDVEATRRISVKSESGEVIIFKISNKAEIYNQEKNKFIKASEIKKDDSLVVFYLANTPVALSYPPQINAEGMVAVNSKAKTKVKVDIFNKEFLASDSMLKLNIADTTKIVNVKGDDVKRDSIINKKVIVIYSTETRSRPPQTSPELIIALDDVLLENSRPITAERVLSEIKKEDYLEMGEVSYVKLLAVAEKTGYTLHWNADSKLVTLTKSDKSYMFKINDKTYMLNLDDFEFDAEPIIEKDRTYVSVKFVEDMLK